MPPATIRIEPAAACVNAGGEPGHMLSRRLVNLILCMRAPEVVSSLELWAARLGEGRGLGWIKRPPRG
jgi:hypothetical protein